MIDPNHMPKSVLQLLLVIIVAVGVPVATSLTSNHYLAAVSERQLEFEKKRFTEELAVERQKQADQSTLEDAKLRIEYVKIALGILQPQKDETEEQRVVLETLAPWAVDVFSGSSPVPLSVVQREALKTRAARIGYVYDYNTGYEFDYGGREHRNLQPTLNPPIPHSSRPEPK